MKVLVLGDHLLVDRLATVLGAGNIEVSQLTELPPDPASVRQNNIDLIIVDNLIASVEVICEQIHRLACAPVVLLLREKEVNWGNLSSIEVDGFLVEAVSSNELLARVKALCHRKKDLHKLALRQSQPPESRLLS